MKITEKQLKDKQLAGKTKEGKPVLYVETHGGLHLFFVKKDKKLESLSAAPHKAIAQWMAEKKEKINWGKDFLGKSEMAMDLQKNEEALFLKLRSLLWGKSQDSIEKNRDSFLLYDHHSKEFQFLGKSELIEEIEEGKVNRFSVIRELSLEDPASLISDHKKFKDLF